MPASLPQQSVSVASSIGFVSGICMFLRCNRPGPPLASLLAVGIETARGPAFLIHTFQADWLAWSVWDALIVPARLLFQSNQWYAKLLEIEKLTKPLKCRGSVLRIVPFVQVLKYSSNGVRAGISPGQYQCEIHGNQMGLSPAHYTLVWDIASTRPSQDLRGTCLESEIPCSHMRDGNWCLAIFSFVWATL